MARPGRAREEVERLITVPLEVEMNGSPNMTVLRFISLYGLSDLRMTFADGADSYFAASACSTASPRPSCRPA